MLFDLEAQLEGFRRRLEQRSLAEGTVNGYVGDARRFEVWWEQQKIPDPRLRKTHPPDRERVESYLRHRDRSASYHNRIHYALRRWSEYREGLSLFGVSYLERRAIERSGEVFGALSLDEIYRLAVAAREHSRSTERMRNFLLPLSPIAQNSLKTWIAERNRLSSIVQRKASIWVTLSENATKKPGDPLDPHGLRAMLARYGESAGIPGKVTPQRLRRAFEVELRGAGVRKPVVQALTGRNRLDRAVSQNELTEAVTLLPTLEKL